MSDMKTCAKCKRSLPADKLHFFVRTKAVDGMESSCKECRGYRFSKVKKQPKSGYKICTDCNNELPSTSEYFGNKSSYCRKCHANQTREYSSNNRELISEKAKKFRVENPGYNNERCREYRINNRALVSEYNKEYKKNNPEIFRVKQQRRDAKKLNLPHTFTTSQWEDAKNYFGNKCAYCDDGSILTMDHFVPLNNGGEFTKDNIIPACGNCNFRKRISDPLVWFRKQDFYTIAKEKGILTYLGYDKNFQQQLSLV